MVSGISIQRAVSFFAPLIQFVAFCALIQRVTSRINGIKNKRLILPDGNVLSALTIVNAKVAFPNCKLQRIVIRAGQTEKTRTDKRNGFIVYRYLEIAAIVFQDFKFRFTLVKINGGRRSTGRQAPKRREVDHRIWS